MQGHPKIEAIIGSLITIAASDWMAFCNMMLLALAGGMVGYIGRLIAQKASGIIIRKFKNKIKK